MDFSFALALLAGQTDITLNTDVKLRDPVIRYVLELFDGSPVKIFQVGGIESLQTQFRWGSGWSDTILDHLANSSFMAERLGYNTSLELGDAIESISEDYDIYYLDGADGDIGDKQTLDQFKKIENTKSVVLIDDIKSKAVSLVKYLKSKKVKFETHHGFGNDGMITIDMRHI